MTVTNKTLIASVLLALLTACSGGQESATQAVTDAASTAESMAASAVHDAEKDMKAVGEEAASAAETAAQDVDKAAHTAVSDVANTVAAEDTGFKKDRGEVASETASALAQSRRQLQYGSDTAKVSGLILIAFLSAYAVYRQPETFAKRLSDKQARTFCKDRFRLPPAERH